MLMMTYGFGGSNSLAILVGCFCILLECSTRIEGGAAFTSSVDKGVRWGGGGGLTTKKSTSLAAKRLSLLTFDLDDTLYPISPVIDEANAAFARAMERYGYEGIEPNDIDLVSKEIRSELPPGEALSLSHTEVRILAIRRQMEKVMLNRKLQEMAEDWVTAVEDLSPVVVDSAREWTSKAVSESVVGAVLSAWEMERHHAAERHVYSKVTSMLKTIRKEHPDIVIGAVTDGKANPLFMTFTLAPYFDFCVSWEDDQLGRKKFFSELSSSSSSVELSWIYNAAVEKGREIKAAKGALKVAAAAAAGVDTEGTGNDNDDGDTSGPVGDGGVWIHVGDDLAYDVGGSSACGAKTILMELADEYEQSARHRFNSDTQPNWSTTMQNELEFRKDINEAAVALVTEKISFMSELPDAVNSILAKASQ